MNSPNQAGIDSESTRLHRADPTATNAGSAVRREQVVSATVYGFLLLVFSSTCCFAQDAAVEVPRGDREAGLEPAAVERRLRASVRYLASDELGGRGLYTRGIDLAADYIAAEFKSAGLKTDAYGGKPFQEFYSSRYLTLGVPNRGEFWSPEGKRVPLRATEDYMPLGSSPSGPFDAPLAFVGYGITAPKLGYDDYAGMNVAGKAVVILRREPQQNDPSSVFGGTKNTEHAYIGPKVANAAEHGAAAVIVCTDYYTLRKSGAVKKDGDGTPPQADPLLSPNAGGKPPKKKIPVLHCRRGFIEPIIQSSRGTTLAELEQQIDKDLKPRSFAIPGWRVTGDVTFKLDGKGFKNVIGVLEGQGPRAEETIVVGAHYDHLGMGGAASMAPGARAIHNGADDNASGTASLVEIARILASRPQKLGRRVVFIAFSAEESGLIGSERYLRSPLVPVKQTVAMINLDMVGRLRNDTITIYGVETAKEFRPMMERLTRKYAFRAKSGAAEEGPSDQISFFYHRIPVLMFFTGMHPQYHTPQDDHQLVNYAGLQRIVFCAADAVTEIANSPQRPTPGQFGLTLADLGLGPNASMLGPRPKPQAGSDKAATTPYLGISSDPNATVRGYSVARVTPGAPAEQAGLRAGDAIVRLGNKQVQKPGDLPQALHEMKPGDRVPILIQRGETEFELEAVLGSR